MGEEIGRVRFTSADHAAFDARLRAETALLARWFAGGCLADSGYSWGFEIEAWLLDHGYCPNPVNQRFLDTLAHPLVVHELSRFNVEINTPPLPLEDGTFSAAERELETLWQHCNAVAHGMDANMVLIGTLPTIRQRDLCLANISAVNRYRALNDAILAARGGAPFRIAIDGIERLQLEHDDVMLEAGTTSFQVHLKVPVSLAHRYYNASMMLSGPVLAAAANAPLLFGRELWQETRIPLFEQAIGLSSRDGGMPRVAFGNRYAQRSLCECFDENRAQFPALLPLCMDEPPEAMRHLRLHNGTIWRWNRPLVGIEDDGRHVRIEHRILPAGPSLTDMIANAAFYLGLVHHWVRAELDRTASPDFAAAQANFHAAARHGLDASFTWHAGQRVTARELLPTLIAHAARGLRDWGIAREDIARYLETLRARVAGGQTGAAWQTRCYHAVGYDTCELMARYAERQRSRAPVHEWSNEV